MGVRLRPVYPRGLTDLETTYTIVGEGVLLDRVKV